MNYRILYCIFIATYLIGCSQRQSAPRAFSSHPASTQKVATDKALQSDSIVARHLKGWLNAGEGQAKGVIAESVRKLYEENNFSLVWVSGQRVTSTAEEALSLLSSAEAYGLSPAAFDRSKLQWMQKEIDTSGEGNFTQEKIAVFDLLLTRAMMIFALQLHQGTLRTAPGQNADGSTFNLVALLQQSLQSGRTASAGLSEVLLKCQPANREYRLLQESLARWVRTPSSPDSAIQHQAQYTKMAINLERWRSEPILDTEYILINLPAFQLQVVDQGKVVQTHRVIVGKPATPSPTLSSQIRYFTTSPDWHVPRNIAVTEMLPRIKRNPGYLAENNLHLYDHTRKLVDPGGVDWRLVTADNFPYSIEQSAGCDNALGNIVFNFANPYAVYVHDTPNRNLFAKPQRALSHGCIRLENPLQLAQLLLQREDAAQSFREVENCVAQQVKRQFNLKRAMPIHIRYSTVAASGDGLLFYKDIYGLDEPLLKAFAVMEKRAQDKRNSVD